MVNLAIVQARMESHRLPGKVLMPICGRPILWHVLDRLRQSRYVDDMVVATAGRGGDCIAGHCEAWGVECYNHAGNPDDVLGRFLAVLQTRREVDMVIRVCADSPCLNPFMLDQQGALVAQWLAIGEPVDYCGWSDGEAAPIPRNGIFAELVTPEALCNADVLATPAEREHVTQAIYRRSDSFFCRWLRPSFLCDDYTPRAIDTRDDYERVKAIMEEST